MRPVDQLDEQVTRGLARAAVEEERLEQVAQHTLLVEQAVGFEAVFCVEPLSEVRGKSHICLHIWICSCACSRIDHPFYLFVQDVLDVSLKRHMFAYIRSCSGACGRIDYPFYMFGMIF